MLDEKIVELLKQTYIREGIGLNIKEINGLLNNPGIALIKESMERLCENVICTNNTYIWAGDQKDVVKNLPVKLQVLGYLSNILADDIRDILIDIKKDLETYNEQ